MLSEMSVNENMDVTTILLGKTGSGKSATGNAILRKEAFNTTPSTRSVTCTATRAEAEYNGRRIKVVDGPGVGDTRLDTKEIVKEMHDRLTEAIMMNDRGYHAFLLVLKFGNRFTDEDKDALEFLRATFGEDFVKNHCVLVMTHGDVFERESLRSGKTFDQWCSEQTGVFNSLLKECNRRIVLFDNYAKREKKISQIEELLKAIHSLDGRRYTNEMFERAARLRVKAQVEARKPFLQGEIMEEISLITQALNREITYVSRLVELSTRCESLIQRVIQNDRSTGVLKDLEARVVDLKQSIDSTIGVQTSLKHDREKWQKEIEEIRMMYSQKERALEVTLQREAAARAEAERRNLQMEIEMRREIERRQREMGEVRKSLFQSQAALEKKLDEEGLARAEAEKRELELIKTFRKDREHLKKYLDKERSEFNRPNVKLTEILKERQESRARDEEEAKKMRTAFDDWNIKTESVEKTYKDQAESSSSWRKYVNGVATVLSAVGNGGYWRQSNS